MSDKEVNNQTGGEKPEVAGGLPPKEKPPKELPHKKKKGARIFWNIFLVCIIALGILSMFGIVREINPEDSANFSEVMRGVKPGYAALLVAVVLGVMVLDTAKFCVISKTVTGKIHLLTSAKTSFLGKYYDAVTPFSTGGQPMQIYYLTTKGNSGGNASATVLIRYFSSIICWVVIGGALMISGSVNRVLDGVSGKTLLTVAGWVGIGVNLIIPVFVTLCLIFPKFMYKLTGGIVKFGHKLKIVKDTDRATERAFKVVNDFRHSFKVMATSPVHLVLLLLVSAGEVLLTFSVPYFVMKALGCSVDGAFLRILSLNAFATFGVSFIPTPGNSGVVEGMGVLAFSAAAGATLVWSVLFWRFSVFYIYIIIGVVMTVFELLRGLLRRKNSQKEEEKK